MRFWLITLLALMVVLAGCETFSAERVREINEKWFETYNQDRNPTAEEDAAFLALTTEQKMEWRTNGKAYNRPLKKRYLDSAKDLYESIEEEIKAKGDE